MRPKNY